MSRPRRTAGFAAPAIRFDVLAVRAALERLLDIDTIEFLTADAGFLLRSIPCERSDRRLLAIEYQPFNFGTQSQTSVDGPGQIHTPEGEPESAEWRIGGPRNEYRVGHYVLCHVPGALRISKPAQEGLQEFRAELRYTSGTDQITGLYRDIPLQFKLLHIRITRFRPQLWKNQT